MNKVEKQRLLQEMNLPMVAGTDPESGIKFLGELRYDGEISFTITLPPNTTHAHIRRATAEAREAIKGLRAAYKNPPPVDLGVTRAMSKVVDELE